MPRLCLALLRFCLSAWVGIAVFFFVILIDLRQATQISEEAKLEHPKVLFPVYYRFEFALLIPAFVGACGVLWNPHLGRGRRIAVLQLVIVALALAVWDYGLIYQKLAEMIATGPPLPPEFQSLHRVSRRLNEAMLCCCAAAALLALVPERPRGTQSTLPSAIS